VNARSPEADAVDSKTESRTRQVEKYGLTAEVAERIYTLMNGTGMSFVDAGLELGLIQPGQVPNNVLSVRKTTEDPGLIQKAVERASSQGQLVLRQGEEVTPGPDLKIAFDTANPRNERMRALRTELLLLSGATKRANVFALLSPDAGEGRSQLCAELAISFAQLGRRTLLVDADMRNPRQHVMFASSNEFGLSHVISLNARPYVHPVKGLPHMFLLTAGARPSNPLELLSDGRYEKLLNEWRTSYEFVVIDTPPVSKYADGIAVATLVGRVVIVSRAQHTSFKHTREMMRRLTTTRAQVLGGIISHF
jgi:protein-tyrosine kinase